MRTRQPKPADYIGAIVHIRKFGAQFGDLKRIQNKYHIPHGGYKLEDVQNIAASILTDKEAAELWEAKNKKYQKYQRYQKANNTRNRGSEQSAEVTRELFPAIPESAPSTKPELTLEQMAQRLLDTGKVKIFVETYVPAGLFKTRYKKVLTPIANGESLKYKL